jgi:type I restriction enzyme, S subunit
MPYMRYGELESSGVSWLQEKPRHWQIKRLKFSTNLINCKISVDESPLPYLGLEHIESWTGRKIDGEISNSEGLASSFVAGDVLFGKLRPYLAKVHLARQAGLISSEALVLRSKGELLAEFLKYYMLSRDFINMVDSSTYGSKMPRASWDFIGNLPVLLPAAEEQRAIARFLDFKIAQIERLIAKQESLLKKLTEKRTALISHAVTKGLKKSVPMKDSGVAWLGLIPLDWTAKRLRFLTTMSGGMTPSTGNPAYWGGSIPWITPKDMKTDTLAGSIDTLTDEAIVETGLTLHESGRVLIVVRGMILAHTFPVAINTVPATVNQDMKALDSSLNAEYLALVLKGIQPLVLSIVEESAHGTKVLRTDVFKNICLPVPPPDVQIEIVRQVKSWLTKLDAQRNAVQSVILRLQEYRSSLITNAVTGKIDLRGFQVPQPAEGLAS